MTLSYRERDLKSYDAGVDAIDLIQLQVDANWSLFPHLPKFVYGVTIVMNAGLLDETATRFELISALL